MNPLRHIQVATIVLISSVSIEALSQETPSKALKKLEKESVKSEVDSDKQNSSSAGLRRITREFDEDYRSLTENYDVDIDVEAIEASVAKAVEAALGPMQRALQSLESLPIALEHINLNIEPIDIEPIEINIEPIEIDLDMNEFINEIPHVDIDIDSNDELLDAEDEDENNGNIDKDKNKDKEKLKEKDKDKKQGKEKDKDKTKGLVKIKKGN